MFTAHSLNPALKIELFILKWVFSYDHITGVAQKNRNVRGVPGISHLPMFDLAIAVMLLRGRKVGVSPTQESGENKGHSPRGLLQWSPPYSPVSPVRTLHLHLQFLAPAWISSPSFLRFILPKSYTSGPKLPTALHSNQVTCSSWLHWQVMLGTYNHHFPLVLASSPHWINSTSDL